MSTNRPQKLRIVSGPGSEYFTGKVVECLGELYKNRFRKISEAVMWKYSLNEKDALEKLSLIDDVNSKDIPDPECIPSYIVPNFMLDLKYTRFKNGEVKAEILESVRGVHAYVVYDVSNTGRVLKLNLNDPNSDMSEFTVNDHLMMIFTITQALTLSGAESVTLVLPTYPYARQHKKASREALTAAMVMRFFESLRVKRIITLDIHSKEIENACNFLHLENLHSTYQNIMKLRDVIDIKSGNVVVVSPDSGAVGRNKFYATTLNCPLAMLYKERDYSIVSRDSRHTNIKSIKLLGDVDGKDVIIADDMIATGGTILNAMKELKKFGAQRIICLVSLPFFDGDAVEEFERSYREGVFYRIIGTNAVYHEDELLSKEWFIQSDVTDLFANIIMRLHLGLSVNTLLDNRHFIQELLEND